MEKLIRKDCWTPGWWFCWKIAQLVVTWLDFLRSRGDCYVTSPRIEMIESVIFCATGTIFVQKNGVGWYVTKMNVTNFETKQLYRYVFRFNKVLHSLNDLCYAVATVNHLCNARRIGVKMIYFRKQKCFIYVNSVYYITLKWSDTVIRTKKSETRMYDH